MERDSDAEREYEKMPCQNQNVFMCLKHNLQPSNDAVVRMWKRQRLTPQSGVDCEVMSNLNLLCAHHIPMYIHVQTAYFELGWAEIPWP
jgi:hypothetical protein